MGVKLENLEGSGKIANSSPINYSYSEDVTPLEPSNLTGGTGQVSATVLGVDADKDGFTHPNSALLINNKMKLTHPESGSVEFRVKQVSKNEDVVSITGDTISSRLNTEVTAKPYGSSGGTYKLLDAIDYYCSLVDVSVANENLYFEPELEAMLAEIPVNFIGWKGNLWEHLKMLCAAQSASLSDNIGFEAYVDGSVLKFRLANSVNASYTDARLLSKSLSINTFDAAKKIKIVNYNTEYKVDAVVHDINVDKSGLSYETQNTSIADGMQVTAGETLVKRFTIDASLETINQPQAVDAISLLPYPGGTGEYAIAGSDGLLIKSAQWLGLGGSLTVAFTENPNEIELTIVAPSVPSIEKVGSISSTDVGYSPYKIGVEVSDGQEYPALYITGTGVFYKKTEIEIGTGAADSFTPVESSSTIDNPFISSERSAYNRGIAAAQAVCGPNVSINESVADVLPFGSTAGSIRKVGSNEFRLTSVSYSPESTNIVGNARVSVDSFNAVWDGKTFSDFKSIALDPSLYPDDTLKFNEFTIIPLMEAN